MERVDDPFGSIVTSTDSEIEKFNRLFLLRKLHKNWSGKERVEDTREAVMEEKAEKCGYCGKERKLKLLHGAQVCTSCSIVQSYAKNNPEVLLAALERFGQNAGGVVAQKEEKKETPKKAAIEWPADLVARVERLEEIGEKIMVIEAARKILFGSPAQ